MTAIDLEAARAGGLCNLRELGGLPTASGGRIRAGVLYRSDTPQSDDPAPTLRPWPPATVIDLRSVKERQAVHPLSLPPYAATVHNVQMLAAANPLRVAEQSFEEGASGLVRLYAQIANDRAHTLVQVAKIVANEPGPTLIHCSAGKDRTGVSIALLLAAVGVPRDEIVADFLRTNENIDMITARVTLYLTGGIGDPSEDMIHRAGVVEEEAIVGTLDIFDQHPDGAAGWLTANGLSADSLARLHKTLVES